MSTINLDDLQHTQLKSEKTGEAFSLSAIISDHFGFSNIFVHHEILQPQTSSSSPHFHTHAEELVLVLNGNPTARCGNEIVQLKPGDFIGFKPGIPEYHVFENKTDAIVTLLVISSNPKEDQVNYDKKDRQ